MIHKIFIIIFLISFFSIPFSHADSYTISELIENANEYNGKPIVVSGEAIGDCMQRKNGVWININDAGGSIGVWLTKGMAKNITYTGSFKTKGDWLRIEGILNKECPVHGADLDIHAKKIELLRLGEKINEPADKTKVKFILTLSGIFCIAILVQVYSIIERKRKAA